jgi:hypothetical protein
MLTKPPKYMHVACHSVATCPSLVSNQEFLHKATEGTCSILQPVVQVCILHKSYIACTNVFRKKLPN